MKKPYLYMIIWIGFCLPFQVSAQSKFEVLYDHQPIKGNGLIAKDAIQALDGNIYIVGRMATNNKAIQGKLFRMDASGKVEEVQEYGTGFDDELNSLIQLPNGQLLLAGSTVQRAKGRKGAWLLLVDYRGTILDKKEIFQSPEEDIEITHLAQNEQGTTMLCGTTLTGKVKSCWVSVLPKGKKLPEKLSLSPLSNLYDNICFAGSFYNGNFLVCGNYQRKKSPRTWYNLYDASGQEIQGQDKNLPASSEQIIGGNPNLLDGTIALVGHTRQLNTFSDVHIMQINEEGKLKKDTFWGDRDIDLARGILPTLEPGLTMLAMRSNTALGYRNKVVFIMPEHQNSIAEQRDISIARLVLSAENHLVGIGTVYDKKESRLWVIGLREKDFTGEKEGNSTLNASNIPRKVKAKEIEDLNETVICSAATFLDDNDNVLTPGESGRLAFNIENKGTTPLVNLKVEAQAKGAIVEGLNVASNAIVLPIPPGRKGVAKIMVKAGDNLKAGNTVFDLQLSIDGQKLCSSSGQIRSQIVGKTAGGTITSLSPSNQRTDKPQEVIKGRYITGTQTGNTTVKIVHNGAKLDDSKASIGKAPKIEGDKFVTDYTIALPLDSGSNKFVVKVLENGEEVDSMEVTINRIMRKPSLHFIGIAPTYFDLNYNRKDVQDFKATIMKQQRGGLYDTVYVQAYTDSVQTSKENLEIIFDELLQRSSPNYQGTDQIDPEDVVMIFISSHGKIVRQSFRVIPSSFRSRNEDATTLDLQEMIARYLSKIESKIILLIDACHSGGTRDIELSSALNALLSAAPGQFILTSSSEEELSYENSEWQNGAFTEALLEALESKARIVDTNKDGYISSEELGIFVKARVIELVRGIKRQQTPKTPRQEKELDLKLPLFKVE